MLKGTPLADLTKEQLDELLGSRDALYVTEDELNALNKQVLSLTNNVTIMADRLSQSIAALKKTLVK